MIKKCPYCLEEIKPELKHKVQMGSIYVCTNNLCNKEIHRDYIEKGGIPSAALGLIGFPGHGKTVYLTSLFYLIKFMRREWERFYFNTLDENTRRILYDHVPLFKNSELPDATPANFPDPALMEFLFIPYFGDFFLSFYDTSGGVFEDPEGILDKGRFVAHSDIVLFIISIHDCGSNWGEHMYKLLDSYVLAVYDRMRVDLKKKQHLIVVLTKADLLLDTDKNKRLSNDLTDYINGGSYRIYLNNQLKRDFISRLLKRSETVKNWLDERGGEGGKGFINMAEDKFKSVEYTLVSSTGAAPVERRLCSNLSTDDPKLVLDPLIWALEKTSPKRIWGRLLARK